MLEATVRRLTRIVAPWLTSVVLLLATSLAASAQTDYFFNAPNGGVGPWDTSTFDWSTVAAGPVNYIWTNSGNERANFGNTAGTVMLGTNITAFGINFTAANYVIAGGGNTLTLSGTGGVINSNVAATISAPIAGAVGLTKTGSGALSLTMADTYSGGTSVTGSTVIGTAQAAGSPFSSGTVTLNMASLRLNSIAATTATHVGDFTVGAATATTTGVSNLIIDNTTGAGSGSTTTFAAGNLIRGGAGSALIVTPQSGALGTGEAVTFSNGSALLTNTILPAWVVATTSGTSNAANFVTYGAAGVGIATYFAGDLTTSANTSVVNQSASPTITGNVAAYALKTNAAINLAGHSLSLGSGTGQAGLILNSGASITGGTVSFGAAEGMIFAQGTATLGAAGDTISGNGLTVTALGAASLTLGGNIVDGTQSSRLIVTGATSGANVTLSGSNTYSGGTILSLNGTATIATDSAFGTGKVTDIIVPGTASPQFQATGGLRTLANAFDLNGGITFNGSNSFVFTGPITIINAAAGGARTLNNTISTLGASVTYGSAGSPSTITLGNPVANGGDGVGKEVIFNAPANSTTFINDTMQDAGAAGSGSVAYSGVAGGVIQVNGLSTYTGATLLNGGSTIQFNHDYHAGDPSSPFGLGTLTPNNSTNNVLEPVGNRTIANPISLATGFTVANMSGDTSSLTLTGPIAMQSVGRTILNSMAAGASLNLGSASSPSTITMSPATGQTLTFAGGGTTVINDVIQDAAGIATAIAITSFGTVTFSGAINSNGSMTASGVNGTVTFNAPRSGSGSFTSSAAGTVNLNAQSTYSGGTTLSGDGTIINIAVSSNALPGPSFTSGPFGTGPINFNDTVNQHMRPIGAQSISNAITMTSGFTMDTAAGDTTSSLTFAGPINMTTVGRSIANGFPSGTGQGGTMILGDPSVPNFITLSSAAAQPLTIAAVWGPIVVNDVIQNSGSTAGSVSINSQAGAINPVILNAANTYTGSTTLGANNTGMGPILISVSSNGSPGSFTTGPFGTGTVTTNNTTTPPTLEPNGADQTIANAITMTSGFFVANTPGTSFNLTFTGPITLTTNRVLTNNMNGTLTLGSAASPSTITLGTTAARQLQFQSQSGAGSTIVNDVIQDPGIGLSATLLVSSGTVQLTNANTYSGGTNVTGGKLLFNNTSGSGTGTGPVTVSGAGAIGGGNSAATTGFIASNLTISTSANPGGTLSPGNSIGTLTTTGSSVTVLNAMGTYIFEHNAGATGPVAPIGGSIADLLKGTGAAVLDLSGLGNGAGQQFNLVLQPVFFPPTLPTQAVTYTIADFSASTNPTPIIAPAAMVGSDLTPFFTVTGAFQPTQTPIVSLTNGNLVQVTFVPVPEPGFILAACGILTVLAGCFSRFGRVFGA